MHITLEALNVIDAIDREGSFSSAARKLGKVPSALSYTVQKLEQDLCVPLFDRRGHRAELTQAGRHILEDGRLLLRAADELENTAKRIDSGWETRLNICAGDLISVKDLFPVIEEFYQLDFHTHLALSEEIMVGSWDALLSGRVDIIVGASLEGPPGGGYIATQLGNVTYQFVTAPHHPLAVEPEPLGEEIIISHRAVVAADTSRELNPRTAGTVFNGQKMMTVPSLSLKREAYLNGFGVGTLPRYMVEEDIREGRLMTKSIEMALPNPPFFVAIRNKQKGKALQWFYDNLSDKTLFKKMLT
jgi:DNA-binding transcriptional LysR family regulator